MVFLTLAIFPMSAENHQLYGTQIFFSDVPGLTFRWNGNEFVTDGMAPAPVRVFAARVFVSVAAAKSNWLAKSGFSEIASEAGRVVIKRNPTILHDMTVDQWVVILGDNSSNTEVLITMGAQKPSDDARTAIQNLISTIHLDETSHFNWEKAAYFHCDALASLKFTWLGNQLFMFTESGRIDPSNDVVVEVGLGQLKGRDLARDAKVLANEVQSSSSRPEFSDPVSRSGRYPMVTMQRKFVGKRGSRYEWVTLLKYSIGYFFISETSYDPSYDQTDLHRSIIDTFEVVEQDDGGASELKLRGKVP
jgi:hypothetical protein